MKLTLRHIEAGNDRPAEEPIFRLATCDFSDRWVLPVESDYHTARAVSLSITPSGGVIVGIAASVRDVLQIVETISVDLVFLHVHFAGGSMPLADVFRPFGAAVAFRTGNDEWFDPDDAIDAGSQVRVSD